MFWAFSHFFEVVRPVVVEWRHSSMALGSVAGFWGESAHWASRSAGHARTLVQRHCLCGAAVPQELLYCDFVGIACCHCGTTAFGHLGVSSRVGNGVIVLSKGVMVLRGGLACACVGVCAAVHLWVFGAGCVHVRLGVVVCARG